MNKGKFGLCFVLLSASLEAKNATQWYELNQNPTPNPSSITVFEDSILDLSVDSNFIANHGTYSGDISIINNHSLYISANIMAVDNAQGSALQTTIYKNFNPNSTITISGDGAMSLNIKGSKQAKSLFDVDYGGNMVIDTWLSARIQKGQSLFSIFRAGQGSKMRFERALNVDVSNAVGKLTPSGFQEALKPIFDISGGSILINPSFKNNDVILKGDIYSVGELVANFVTSGSLFDGKVVLREGSTTTLKFDEKASGKFILDLANQAQFALSMDNHSRIDGTLDAIDTSSIKLVIDNSVFAVNANFDDNTQSEVQIVGGDWEGDIQANNASSHSLSITKSGAYMGDLRLLGNASVILNADNSRIQGSISVFGNGVLKNTMSVKSSGNFDLSLASNSQTNFSLLSQSQYRGKINLSGNSLSTFLIDSGSSFSSQVSISDTPNFSVQMQGGSVSKANFIFAFPSAPTKSQISIDNATFLGSITQRALDYAQVTLDNQAIWAIEASSQVNSLELNGNSVVDFTTANFDSTQKRTQTSINESNRIILQASTIKGNNGTFNLFGILNRSAWGKDANGGTIATDKISTSTLLGSHNIKIFWDVNHLDTTLLDANLYDDHIVVAEQNGVSGGGEFVGVRSEVGVYQYETKLSKIEKRDASGNVVGYEWILGEATTPTPDPQPPTPDPQPPTPDPDPQPPVVDPDPNPPIINPKPPMPQPSIELSSSAKLINTLLSSQYKIWHFQVENLHTRLGDLRNITTSSNVWAKVKYGLMLGEGDEELIDSKQMNTTLSFGADYSFYTPYGRIFIGGGFDVSFYQDFGGELDGSAEAYRGASTSFGVSVYDTFLFHNGIYIDSVLKYYYTDNEFSIALNELSSNAPKFSHHGLIASVEVGKKFRLPIPVADFARSFYYLKPEVGMSVGYLMGANVGFAHLGGHELDSTLSSSAPIQTRLGVEMGKRFDSERVLGDVFLGFGCEYTALSKGDVKIVSPINEVSLKSRGLFNLKFGVGGNVIFDDRVRMYFDVDSKFLGYIQPVLNINVGVKVIFGERIKTAPRSPEAGQIPTSAEYIYLN